MPPADPKSYLWPTICRLMREAEPSIDAVRKRTKLGRGTVQRIKEGETSVGVDVLVKIAGAFGVTVWQLLVPELDPERPPRLSSAAPLHWPFASVPFDVIERLDRQRVADVERGLKIALASAGVRLESPAAVAAPLPADALPFSQAAQRLARAFDELPATDPETEPLLWRLLVEIQDAALKRLRAPNPEPTEAPRRES